MLQENTPYCIDKYQEKLNIISFDPPSLEIDSAVIQAKSAIESAKIQAFFGFSSVIIGAIISGIVLWWLSNRDNREKKKENHATQIAYAAKMLEVLEDLRRNVNQLNGGAKAACQTSTHVHMPDDFDAKLWHEHKLLGEKFVRLCIVIRRSVLEFNKQAAILENRSAVEKPEWINEETLEKSRIDIIETVERTQSILNTLVLEN